MCLTIPGQCFRYLWNAFFIWRRILALSPPCVTILGYNWDVLGTKFVGLSIHWDICRNSKSIEPQDIDDGILRHMYNKGIRHTYNKERNLVPLAKKLLSSFVMSKPKNVSCSPYIQVLVLIAWGRYICMKKNIYHHHLMLKARLWILMPHKTYRHVEIL